MKSVIFAITLSSVAALASGEGVPPIPDTPASARAAGIVAKMTDSEKYALLNGIGWTGLDTDQHYYVGNVPENVNYGVPAIKMQDAAQGFRTTDAQIVGEVTSWPCCLAVSATWDTSLGLSWGRALGEEHASKGANVILGPSVNVHRVARGGRNAEYLSGESPYLGAAFTREYVLGVQSQNISAVVKHYGFNNQETDRNTVDVHVDERTAFEVYYPPFLAAVDAGAGAAMCSYNLVNGTHSCANSGLLDRDLKTRMGFGGFVMSDWWAVHADGYENAGLDMDMPGNDGYFDPSVLSASAGPRVDSMVTRVLSSLISTGIYDAASQFGSCTPPNCDTQLYDESAKSGAHSALARKIAAESVVLLKNEGGVLPLKANAVVAVVGSACDAPNDIDSLLKTWNLGNYYTIGGSGRVIGADPVSILAGLQGVGGYTLQTSISDEVSAAEAAMKGAELVLVCGATTSTEGADRANLRVDQESFIGSVLSAATTANLPSVVLLTTPGSVLTPWVDSADAMAVMFMGGEESGSAWGDVLSGRVNPAGKLPVTFPVEENDMVAPCGSNPCNYSEELVVGWRALEGKAVHFPFGHGLSYTTFSHTWAQQPTTPCSSGGTTTNGGTTSVVCMSVTTRNTGAVSGADVVQLYIGFPNGYGEPVKQLKGFQKTAVLQSGASSTVSFSLSVSDLSYWCVKSGGWRQAVGEFTVSVGQSSRNLTLVGGFRL